MAGSRVARRDRFGSNSGREPEPAAEALSRRERAANSLDHYSLALQLIQVFPIVSELTVLVVASTWLARIVSGICLLLGTVWVIQLERSGGIRSRRQRADDGELPRADIPAQQAGAPDEVTTIVMAAGTQQSDALVHTAVVGEYGHINISICVQPTATEASRRQRRIRQRRAGSPQDCSRTTAEN